MKQQKAPDMLAGLTAEIMYDALVRRDSQFEGSFFAGVKTTGIFCRPGCTARSPRFENVEFFHTSKEALMHGYRPCKICTPLDNKDEAPSYIKE
ncbi:MAG: Ada metal-binding domain-containing protein, partial [Bacteroidota bacterium]|nr:Ada metal-binding domain-containing protein [Bacteroidota bacterium]